MRADIIPMDSMLARATDHDIKVGIGRKKLVGVREKGSGRGHIIIRNISLGGWLSVRIIYNIDTACTNSSRCWISPTSAPDLMKRTRDVLTYLGAKGGEM